MIVQPDPCPVLRGGPGSCRALHARGKAWDQASNGGENPLLLEPNCKTWKPRKEGRKQKHFFSRSTVRSHADGVGSSSRRGCVPTFTPRQSLVHIASAGISSSRVSGCVWERPHLVCRVRADCVVSSRRRLHGQRVHTALPCSRGAMLAQRVCLKPAARQMVHVSPSAWPPRAAHHAQPKCRCKRQGKRTGVSCAFQFHKCVRQAVRCTVSARPSVGR